MSAGSAVSAAAGGLGPMVAGRAVQGPSGAVFPLCMAAATLRAVRIPKSSARISDNAAARRGAAHYLESA
ncbi:hypothetical protein [Actinoplanes sp. NPDC049681]|uniref:hypothetical protein n=1 Tax=Actinoplanes sp. NPDC049681 TaxID=3363905 RepID=UPI0037B0ACA8